MSPNFEKINQKFDETDAEKLVKAALGQDAFDRKERKKTFNLDEQMGELEVGLQNLYFDLFADLKANPKGEDEYRQELYRAINETEQQLFSFWRQAYPKKPEIRIHQEVGNRIEEIKQEVLQKINPEKTEVQEKAKEESKEKAA